MTPLLPTSMFPLQQDKVEVNRELFISQAAQFLFQLLENSDVI